MRWRVLAAILVGLVLACGGYRTGPQGTSCESEGATKYTSRDGTYVCTDTGYGLRWEHQ